MTADVDLLHFCVQQVREISQSVHILCMNIFSSFSMGDNGYPLPSAILLGEMYWNDDGNLFFHDRYSALSNPLFSHVSLSNFHVKQTR